MAANITISSASLATDGKTLTATLTGGTGSGYSPSSGVNGFLVVETATANALKVASATISGSTLTLNLAGFVLPGTALTVTVKTNGNVTDSGGNTLAGSTGNAVTNNSTVAGSSSSILHSDAAFFAPGYWLPQAWGGRAGGYPAADTYRRIQFTGKQVQVAVYGASTGGTIKVSVDGAAWTSIPYGSNNPDAGVWTWVTITDPALSDASHTVAYRVHGGAFYTQDESAASFRVFGSAPSVSRASGDDGTWVRIDTNATKVLTNHNAPAISVSTLGNYPTQIRVEYPGAAIRTRAKGHTLRFWVNQTSCYCILNTDGTDGSPFTAVATYTGPDTPNGFSFGIMEITGLDDSAYHEYTLNIVDISGSLFFFQVLARSNTGGGIDLTTSPTAFETNIVMSVSDSTALALQRLPHNVRNAWGYRIATAKGWQNAPRAISGSTLHNFGGSAQPQYTTSTGSYRAANPIFGLGANDATVVCEQYGTNDLGSFPSAPFAGGGTPAGAATPLTQQVFEDSCYDYLTNLLINQPSALLLVGSILERAEANNNNGGGLDNTYGLNSAANQLRLACNARKLAAVNRVKAARPADASRIVYVDFDGVLSVVSGSNSSNSSPDLDDHIHPSATGDQKIANRFIAAYNATLNAFIPHRLVNGGRCRPRLVNAGLIGRN